MNETPVENAGVPVDDVPRGMMACGGELISRRRLTLRGLLLAGPGLIWITAFLAIPCLALFAISFAQRGTYGEIEWVFTFDNMKRLAGYGFFGWSADNLLILWRSVVVAVVTTVFCILVSYPLAFFLAARPKKTRVMWLTFLLVPFWTNLVIRTYAWLLVLGPGSMLSQFCARMGIIPAGSALYPSAFAVYLGMVSTFLPFVTLPLYAAVEKIEWSRVEACRDLYGGAWRVFRHGLLPQTLPGLSVGITLTLIPAMGMFVVPDMLSGARNMLVGNLIQQQFGTSRDWPFGAAVSLAMMLMTLIVLFLIHARKPHAAKKTEAVA